MLMFALSIGIGVASFNESTHECPTCTYYHRESRSAALAGEGEMRLGYLGLVAGAQTLGAYHGDAYVGSWHVSQRISAQDVYAGLRAHIPLSSRWEVSPLLAVARVSAQNSEEAPYQDWSSRTLVYRPMVGANVSYKLTDSTSLSLSAQHISSIAPSRWTRDADSNAVFLKLSHQW